MRLVDADALLQRAIPHGWSTPKWVSDIMIDDAPTIDAVPVVRCRECKYGVEWDGRLSCEWHGFYATENDWYCADGKRREEDE